MNFSAFHLHGSLLKAVVDAGYLSPTSVQEQAIPKVLEGRDLLCMAQTGTGKTAAFLLPVMHRLLSDPQAGMQVLVLEPTRELALQVVEHAGMLGRYTSLRAACVYGGVGFGPQTEALQSGVEIVAATPGRLLDHMRQGHVEGAYLRVLVLDEVDRMLDMGFLPEVREILRHLPKQRQTLFFSATIPGAISRLAEGMLSNPARVAIAPEQKTAEGIEQKVFPVSEHLKISLLGRLLDDQAVSSGLVFTRRKIGADKVCAVVGRHGFSVERIHSDRSQKERQQALQAFRNGTVRFLVATDIAARGLDIEGISHVINYDVPESPDDYVHRIGRTARAGAKGQAWSLMSPRDAGLIAAIEAQLSLKLERHMIENFNYDEKLGPQHELRQGHDIRSYDVSAQRQRRSLGSHKPAGFAKGALAQPAPPVEAVLRDADERAEIIIRRKGSVAPAAELQQAPQPLPGQAAMSRRRRGRRGQVQGRRSAQTQPASKSAEALLSATEVLRRAGQQQAAVAGSALELRPKMKPVSPPLARVAAGVKRDAPLAGGGRRRRRGRARSTAKDFQPLTQQTAPSALQPSLWARIKGALGLSRPKDKEGKW